MRRIGAVLIALFVWSLSLTARAAEIPDPGRSGSITVTMNYDGTPLDGGSLRICRVGEIREENGVCRFVLIPQLQGSGLSADSVSDRTLAQKLAAWAEEKALSWDIAPIRNGRAEFAPPQPGLFLIVQEEEDASEGFAPISPFLICAPRYENGTWVYHVEAEPKVPPETLPAGPGLTLPQTGQLSWPVPVLAFAGVALLAAGALLCVGRKPE